MLSDWIELQYTIAGFLVGALVGMTGVGGGSLMTPILIVLFGVSPATAVGTDLLFAAATKTIGSLVHGYNRSIEWRVVRRLATGSIPATLLALVVLSWLQMSTGGARHLITTVLSIALLLTAVTLICRNRISALYAQRLGNLDDRSIAGLTIAMGALLGMLVTFSSVGAGAIGVTALVLLYPQVSTADRRFRYRSRGAADADRRIGSRSNGIARFAHARVAAPGIVPRDRRWQFNFNPCSRRGSPLCPGSCSDPGW